MSVRWGALLLLLSALLVLRPSVADAAASRMRRSRKPVTRPRKSREPRALLATGACAVVTLASALLIPGPVRLPAAAAVFFATRAALRRLPAPTAPPPAPHLLAAGAELLAACLEAGALPVTALAVTGRSLPEPLRSRFAAAAKALRNGVAIGQALPESGELAPLASVFRRSAQTGSSMAGQLVAVAEQLRSDEHFERLERARRVGVLSALPLGLCMLPAFLLLAVVPAVIGLGAGVLH
jgi:Flp pilus assembly protein TadB